MRAAARLSIQMIDLEAEPADSLIHCRQRRQSVTQAYRHGLGHQRHLGVRHAGHRAHRLLHHGNVVRAVHADNLVATR